MCVARPTFVCLVPLLIVGLCGAGTSHAEEKIEGSWTLVATEFVGQPFDALNGATLVMSKGNKTFTLPDGKIETGEYSLDPKQQPKEINASTRGKSRTARGIYRIDGKMLTMCLSQSGTSRPTEFATTAGSDLVLLKFEQQPDRQRPTQPRASPVASSERISVSGTRPFHMGFTGFVYDMTLPAVAASRQFVRENGDILAHHIEGVPWAEAMLDEPFPDALLNEWRDKKLATPPNGRVYLAVSPGRGELKPADKAGPVPPELRGKAYDHPLVKNAFLNYCRRGIEFFEPDYLGIGIEVNEIYSSSPAKWRAYVDLHKHVYRELKKSHPQLPIFASFTLHNTYKERGPMLTEFQALMPFNDLVAVSYYPFIVGGDGRLRALDWMTEQFDRFDKPYAIVETNDAAERLTFPQAGFVIEGTPEGQLEYYRKLLSMAQQRKFEFVISFIHQDYDALWERIKNQSPEMFMAWRDCGLLDQDGNARPAYDLWHGYFQLKQTAPSTRQTPLQLQLRRRVEASKDNGQYKIENRRERWNPDETAIIICDMWDDHTCRGAAARVAEIAPAIGRTVKAAREQGVFIIHAPNGCMSFYEGTPQRDRALEATPATAPVEIKWNQWNKEREGEPLADIVDGGCSCPKPCPNFRVDDDGVRHWIKGGKIPWARQIKSIEIGTQDAISDSGQEIHNLLEQRGIDNVILMGVHTNICVSGRPFGLRQMVYFGKNVVLCRDLTDALFQSPSAGIDQFRGTDLVVEHIEKHICPTITSASITGQAEFRFQANTVNRQ